MVAGECTHASKTLLPTLLLSPVTSVCILICIRPALNLVYSSTRQHHNSQHILTTMCIIFFESHAENTHEHYIDQYHCAHDTCDGRFESHAKYLLQGSCADCRLCLNQADVNPDISPVRYYPPVEDVCVEKVGFGEIRFGRIVRCEGAGVCLLRQVDHVGKKDDGDERQYGSEDEKGQYDDDDWRSYKNLSDVDSVTSHWRLDEQEQEHEITDIESEHAATQADETIKASRPCSTSTSTDKDSQLHETHQHAIPFIAPGTARHRCLVSKQLAQLPHHITHAREHPQPIPVPLPPAPPPAPPGPHNAAFQQYYRAEAVAWQNHYIPIHQLQRNPGAESMWQGNAAYLHNHGMPWHPVG